MAQYFESRRITKGHQLQALSSEPVPYQTQRFNDGSTLRMYKSAEVTYKPHTEIPMYGGTFQPEDMINAKMRYHSPEERAAAIQRQKDTPQLFFHTPARITGAFADPSMRAHIPTLLGIVLNREGSNTIPGSSLSVHSSRIVKKAVEREAIQPNPRNIDSERGNSLTLIPRTTPLYTNSSGGLIDSTHIDPADLMLGKQKVREILGRSQHLSPQFGPVGKQLQIPGLED